jgi:hypothetical protein
LASRWFTSAFWNARASASGSHVRSVTALRFSPFVENRAVVFNETAIL